MCGIAGQVNFNKPIVETDISAMNDALRHRGPDGFGVYVNENKSVGLGHRRLSFLDLSEQVNNPCAPLMVNYGYL